VIAVLHVLYGAGLTVGASLALGSLLLGRLRDEFRRIEWAAFAFLTGAAGLSFLTCLLGALHWIRRGVLQAVAVGLISAAVWRSRRRSQHEPLPPAPGLWQMLFWIVFAGYGFLYFFHALAPEASPDGSAYHLEIVGEYARAHGLVPIPTNMYASLSQGMEMLFLFAFVFGRHSAAALVHFSFLLALPWLLFCYGRRFGHPGAGAFAGIAVFACPLAGIDGVSAYNDVALTATAFGLFYILEIWRQSGNCRLIPLAGLLAGFCYALKYTGAFMIPLALGYVAWRAGSRRWRDMLAFSIPAAMLVAPWLVKNWLWVGNPLAPFFNAWFPNPFIHISFEISYRASMARMQDGSSRWAGLWDVLTSGRESQGAIGPLFLLAPLALLAVRRGEVLWLLSAAALLPGYVSNFGGRFLLPLLPFVSLAIGIALERWSGILAVLAAVHATISLPGMLPKYLHPYAWKLDWPPYAAALRRIPEDVYLSQRLETYPVARRLDAELPGTQMIYAISNVPQAYTRHRILVGYQSAFNEKLREFLLAGIEPAQNALREYRYRFPASEVRKLRLVQTAPRNPGEWSVTELRVWRGGTEAPRQPAWRINARPNPWDVQLAFDNSYVTRWCTREPVAPGMWLELDMGRPERVDMVTVEAAPGQPVSLRLDGQTAGGSWLTLARQPEEAPLRAVTGTRRAAMHEFKVRGVNYILVSDTEPLAEDLYRYAKYWGIREVFEMGGMRLYHVE